MKSAAGAISALMLSACSSEPVDRQTRLTGSAIAVAGLPRHHAPGRFELDGCCSFRLARDARAERLEGIDSLIQQVSGPKYTLRMIFGPYDGALPEPGFARVGSRVIDGVELVAYRWTAPGRQPSNEQRLWLARVGGGWIDGVVHTPWGLRILVGCDTATACRTSGETIDTIRF